MTWRTFLLGIVALFFFGIGSAQDIHFSQFYYAPLQLNPSLTGVNKCSHRVSVNYREQWLPVLNSSRYSSAMLSYDMKKTSGRNDYWGLGFNFWNDVTGSTNFRSTKATLSLAYSKYLGGRSWRGGHYLSVGGEIAGMQRGIDFAAARYGIQNVNGVFDSSIPSGENFDTAPIRYLDLSTGLVWFGTTRRKHGWYLGLAAHHINRPDQSFSEDQDFKIYTRYTVHGGFEYKTKGLNSIIPNFVYIKQGPSINLNYGASYRIRLLDNGKFNKALQLGLSMRMVNNYVWKDDNDSQNTQLGVDALIAHIRFELESINIGFSYDANVSDLRVASSLNNALELSLVYLLCGPEVRNTYCPYF